jgi:F-type H+-transporting ATPase subunit delta
VAGNEVGRVYASALLEIGQEKKILPLLEEELGFVVSLLKADRDLMIYLNSPKVSKDAKKSSIDRFFGGELSEVMVNLLKVVIDNNRQGSLEDVYQSLRDFIDIINNRQRVSIVTSSKMDAEVLKKIKDALANKFSKEIIINEVVDESIIGGVVIKIGDLIIDGSLAKDLKNIKDKLLLSKVRSEVAYED